ncbi:MAG: ribonuclease ribonuclease [Candidatus Parcubacteria bacterium]|jgi:ribonuclease HII
MQWVIGIDEAGRGPLAGPVAVCAVRVPSGFNWDLIPGVGDSKKVSPKNREAIFRRAQQLHQDGHLQYAVALISARVIDAQGIRVAITRGITKCLKQIEAHHETVYIKLDGSLKAPPEFLYQRTIVKGDATEQEIGLASIMAKVTRDRHMVRLAATYPHYGFEVHKGYGTLAHRQNIKKHGLSAIHRATFCRGCR